MYGIANFLLLHWPTLAIIFLIIPLVTWVLFHTSLFLLASAARRTKLHIRRLQQEIVKDGHFLDLDPVFVDRMFKSRKYCRVLSLASYLESLDYGGDEATARRIVTSLVSAFGGESWMPMLPLLPASLMPSKSAVQSSGLMARFAVSEFPSILACAAAIDSTTQLSKQVEDKDANVNLKHVLDSPDICARGEAESSGPPLPDDLLEGNAMQLNCDESKSLRAYVVSNLQLGDRPDVKRYVFPRPFSPDLLPGLCLGHGGLEPTVTPRQQAQNRVLTAIFNKLASNYMVYCGYGYSPLSKSPNVPYREFSVTLDVEVPDEDGNLIKSIKEYFTCGDFLRALLEFGGGTLEARIRTNLTSFDIALCVLDEDATGRRMKENPADDDLTDSTRRFEYFHIPFAFCSRTGVSRPDDGLPIHQLSSHSSVEWHFKNNKILGGPPGEEWIVTFYTGLEGFSGFKPGGEWDRAWVIESEKIVALDLEEGFQAMDLCACEAVCANICVREWKMPFGGYGGLGVCADSVALIEQVLRGRTSIFPLFMRADAKAAMLYVIREHLRVRSLKYITERSVVVTVLNGGGVGANGNKSTTPSQATEEDDYTNITDPKVRSMIEFLDLMNRVARALIRLPNDIQCEPHRIGDSIDRIYSSTMNSAFYNDRKTRADLKQIKENWNRALHEFETDFEEVGGNQLRMRLQKQPSHWRL